MSKVLLGYWNQNHSEDKEAKKSVGKVVVGMVYIAEILRTIADVPI